MAGRVCSLSAGGRHDALLTEDGEVLIWGNNAEGQLATGNNIDGKEVREEEEEKEEEKEKKE